MLSSRIVEVRSLDDLDRLLSLSEEKPVMVLKHSTRCAVSAFAHEEFRQYAEKAAGRGIECALVRVVEERAVARQLAEVLGVRHQSPQAILVRNRRAVWNDSHEGVTAAALEEAESA